MLTLTQTDVTVKIIYHSTLHHVNWDSVRSEASPDPLHGSVGMSALWATMEDATLSPRAHMALLDGPESSAVQSVNAEIWHEYEYDK